MRKIDSLETAVDFFNKSVLQGSGNVAGNLRSIRGIYCLIVHAELPTPFGFTTTEKFFCFFKREWYKTFGKEYFDKDDEGQTVSYKALEIAQAAGATIALIMPDSTVWTVPATQFHAYVLANKTIRQVQDEGYIDEEASLPKNLLKRAF